MRTSSVVAVSMSGLLVAGCSVSVPTFFDLKSRLSGYLDSNPVSIVSPAETTPVVKMSRGWHQGGNKLQDLGDKRWLNVADQAVVQIVCGHVRRWERPGSNLESLSPLQGDPFLLPDPNQLVSAQTWFWVVSVSDDGPRVAQSRYQKMKTDDGGYRLTELWEIRDLNYSVKNEYVFNAAGSPTGLRQSVHPGLPTIELSQISGDGCER
jgi:hypothetical protein